MVQQAGTVYMRWSAQWPTAHGAVRLGHHCHACMTSSCVVGVPGCTLVLQDYIRKKNKWLVKIHEWVQAHGGDPIIPFSGAFENEVRQGPDLLGTC